jgi:hypothetical protein
MSTHAAAPTRQSFALDVAAPSLRPDRDAPWTGAPAANGDAGLAAMFWISFHGLSVFIHTVLITLSVAGPMILAIVPVPFLAAMCSEVKVVDKPIERVEMAIVELPPEPPPEPPPAPVEDVQPLQESGAIKVAKLTKKRTPPPDMVEMGVLALLTTSDNSAVLGALSSKNDDVFGGLIGTEMGESFGVGGLGLSGVGEGGGGRGEGMGLGSIGTIGRGGGGGGLVVGEGTGSGYGVGGGRLGKSASKRVRVALHELAQSERARLQRMLGACNVEETINGTVVVVDDAAVKVTLDPANACASRMLKRTLFDADGTFAVTISPVTP